MTWYDVGYRETIEAYTQVSATDINEALEKFKIGYDANRKELEITYVTESTELDD